ncbi:hypothetical protein LEN26_013200 [Aphanomyces euteiches]|nr:hypothetical protein LEN26_013200 [Aphanomyces euteiches]KAH9123261.1 hypothetical protein AeMF1_005705 [Aphanomyces euteiches]KAH9184393.1 hypothetical protein AeNC1_013630 [Aphanomyces euteiches]
MGVYYAKKRSFLDMLRCRPANYMAVEIRSHQRLLLFINDKTIFSLDQILDIAWSSHKTVTMQLEAKDGRITKQKLAFDCQADLFYFLVELGMEPAQVNGKVQRGSFCKPQRRLSYSSRSSTSRRPRATLRTKSDTY